MRLSVVVGTLNRREQLQACVESIFEQTTTPLRVFVTDAGSTDGTLPYLESLASDRLVPILEGRRLGQARAYNQVFARLETPYVCWLSDDNVVVNRGLDAAVAILDENAAIGMVGLKVKDVQGPFIKAPYIGGVSPIGILNVNQGLLRTPLLKQVAGFSEAFRDYGIDPDLTAKILFSGFAVVYTRSIAIHHQRNWSADRTSEDYALKMEKQKVYLDLYRRKYRDCARGGFAWMLRKLVWRQLQRTFGVGRDLNSDRPFLGLMARDWHNIFTSRYIRLSDPWRCRGKAYHLLQHCPRRHRPASLPPDPVVPPEPPKGEQATASHAS